MSIGTDYFGLLENLVTKRTNNFDYLKRLHEGEVYWLNIVSLTQTDISSFYTNSQTILRTRTNLFFFLGLSLGPFLQIPNGPNYLQSLASLFEEYSSEFKVRRFKKIKLNVGDDTQTVKSKTFLSDDSNINYQFLILPKVNTSKFDYFQVIFALFDLLTHCYRKFLDPSCENQQCYEAIVSIDNWISGLILNPILEEIEKIANNILFKRLSSFDPMFQEVVKKKEIDYDTSNKN
ncbi:hypothetical protein M0811_10192 [Anaeramoeba ignava]|uniref:Uncharacterized protein n=1 Tax=Anaeramoeba ignava TaxID=1746090 RepID=A0A9Q0LFM6_ANAIG|nr:hypothetical protein M0811_10192 [Anaeramoeba ignava]